MHWGRVEFRAGSEWKSAKLGFLLGGDPFDEKKKNGGDFFFPSLDEGRFGVLVEWCLGGTAETRDSIHPEE